MAVTEANVKLIEKMAEVLTALGVQVDYEPGWKSRYANSITLNPHLLYVHHTGSDTTPISTIRDGRSDLPGPLSQFYGPRNQGRKIRVIAAGYANHGGGANKAVLDSLRDGDVDEQRTIVPGADNTFANRYALGVEFVAKGAFTDDQYYTALALSVAFSVASGAYKDVDADGRRMPVIGHKEGTRRKVDPIFDMHKFRVDAEALLRQYLGEVVETPPVEPEPEIPATDCNPHFDPDLVVDGLWGAKTTYAMRATLRGKYAALGLDGVPLAAEGELDKNAYAALQRTLNRRFYELGWVGRLVVDGIFGPKSAIALQKYVGASPTGDFDKASTKALQSALNTNKF